MLIDNIIHYNPTNALITINDVLNEGKNLDNFLWEIIKYLKDILLYKTCGNLPLYNESELDQIKSLVEDISKDRLLSLIYELSELANSIKWSTQKQIVFETGIIRVCTNVTGLEDRIKVLEDKLRTTTAIDVETKKSESIEKNISNPKKTDNVAATIARSQKAENVVIKQRHDEYIIPYNKYGSSETLPPTVKSLVKILITGLML